MSSVRLGARYTFLMIATVSAPFNIAPPDARSALVINEVLYDPDGPDAGQEFVEIANNGPFAATLEGLSLDAGDGSRSDDWKTVWTGRADVAIPPGGLYRVGLGGPGEGEPADLDLQNGPDGVRLMKSGFELDRLGWGNLAHPEYYEGVPAPAVRSGRSLARREDGLDRNDNAADFEEATPTPGRPNHPRFDWALRIASVEPIRPRPGDRIIVRIREENRGAQAAIAPPAEIDDGARPIAVGWDETVPPAGSAERLVLLDAPEEPGRITLRARIFVRDAVPENDSDSIGIRVGVGPVRITEILASPRAGDPEWIEVSASGTDGSSVEGYDLYVRSKQVRLLPRVVSESTRVSVVTEDSLRMRQACPSLRPSAIWPYEGRWPRIRDGERSGTISDSILVRSPDGVIEEIALPGTAPAPGVSLERIEADLPEGPSAWVPCADPSGSTPGRVAGPSRMTEGDDGISIRPRVIHPGSTGCVIEGRTGSEPGEVRLTILDLNGREIRCLLHGIWATGSISAPWDGRDESGGAARPGIYVAVMEISRKGRGVERRRAGLAVAPGTEP